MDTGAGALGVESEVLWRVIVGWKLINEENR